MGTGKQLISVGVLAMVAGAAWAAPQSSGLGNPFADTIGGDNTRGPVSPIPVDSPGGTQGDPGTPPGAVVPLPSAALLGAAGLGVIGGLYRRRHAR